MCRYIFQQEKEKTLKGPLNTYSIGGFSFITRLLKFIEIIYRLIFSSFLEFLVFLNSGFLCGTSVLDKDGVSAAVVIAEMASCLETMNITLKQQLIKVYEK